VPWFIGSKGRSPLGWLVPPSSAEPAPLVRRPPTARRDPTRRRVTARRAVAPRRVSGHLHPQSHPGAAVMVLARQFRTRARYSEGRENASRAERRVASGGLPHNARPQRHSSRITERRLGDTPRCRSELVVRLVAACSWAHVLCGRARPQGPNSTAILPRSGERPKGCQFAHWRACAGWRRVRRARTGRDAMIHIDSRISRECIVQEHRYSFDVRHPRRSGASCISARRISRVVGLRWESSARSAGRSCPVTIEILHEGDEHSSGLGSSLLLSCSQVPLSGGVA
jgi:hypothetical protein